MTEKNEMYLNSLKNSLSLKGISSLCNIVEILGEEQLIKLAEILCTKYDLAGSSRSQLKESILKEAEKKGEKFFCETELSLSDYFSHDYDNLEEKDDIFKGKTARLDLMVEQMLEDAVVMETVGTAEIEDVFSRFTDEEKQNILKNIHDEDIKEFLQTAFGARLSECKEKYKWYRNYILKLKRFERRLMLRLQ